MKLRILAIVTALTILLQGCASEPRPYVPTEILELPTTPSMYSTSRTPSVLVTSTVSPAITIVPTQIHTPTTTNEPVPSIQKTCLTQFPGLPNNKIYPGRIVLLSSLIYNTSQDYYIKSSFYDLNIRQIIFNPPEKILDIATSPDGEKYAVRDVADNKIKIYSANGQLLKSLPKGKYSYGIDHWPNNESIILVVEQPLESTNYMKYPRDEVLVNLSTNETVMLPANFPGIDTAQAQMIWEGFSTTKYDPEVTRVVYPAGIEADYLGNKGKGYILWDNVNKKILVQLATGDFQATPKWSPDGSKFIVNSGYAGDGEFYIVTRDGAVSLVSHLNSDPKKQPNKTHYFSDSYSWSPDGRLLAFWREVYQDSAIQATLAILDTVAGKITDFCLSAGVEEKGEPRLPQFYAPIWSPDGKFLATVANLQVKGSMETTLIDLEGGMAAKIADNVSPAGWLVDAVK